MHLGSKKGYTLIATDSCGVNAFFVQTELIAGNFTPSSPEALYHPAAFKGKKENSHPRDSHNREWIPITE